MVAVIEVFLFDAFDRDSNAVRQCMDGLSQSRAFTIAPDALKTMKREFSAGRATQKQAASAIRDMLDQTQYLVDPHTAAGIHVAHRFEKPNAPMVTLATAHPAKFPDAVKSACDVDPALPSWLCDLMRREETFELLQPDLDGIESYIARHARASEKSRNKS